MRTSSVLLILAVVSTAALAAPEAPVRRQALFVRTLRQQPPYHLDRPANPLEHDPNHDRQIRAAQNLPLENVFRWFRGQFNDRSSTSGRKAPRELDQHQGSSLDEPSREYLPLPSPPKEKPRPFVPPSIPPQPQPSRPSSTRPAVGPPSTSRPTTLIPNVGDSSGSATNGEETHSHGAHIHNIDVTCAKDEMTIRLEFSGPFDGVIYSKGFYNQQSCRYVAAGSGQNRAEFTVRLDSCGTQFVDEFATGGQAYLENVLVLQNEPGIQEVWDTIRRVRCLWAGNINKALSVALNVDVLEQEVVTFSGDTATARLDIQLGKGPFAAPASGLVKIGETMTLVVSVEGDPGFDIGVGECVAHAGDRESGGPVVKLTDSEGCPLKAKLFPEPFQTTRDTGGSGASILAFAHFQAFKFPDQMELYIECDVELCKTGCRVCSRQNSLSSRRKRSSNDTVLAPHDIVADPVRLVRKVHVVTEDDLALLEDASNQAATIINVASQPEGAVCLSIPTFMFGSVFLLMVLLSSSMLSACLWLKNQRLQGCGA